MFFYKSLPWLVNRNLLLKNVNVAISFSRNIASKNVWCVMALSGSDLTAFIFSNAIFQGAQILVKLNPYGLNIRCENKSFLYSMFPRKDLDLDEMLWSTIE